MLWQKNDESCHIQINDDCSLFITAEQKVWGQSSIETIILLEDLDAVEHLEESLQLLEGCNYTYELTDSRYCITDVSDEIFRKHPRRKHEGRITPGIYVGRLAFSITGPNDFHHEIAVEVRSVKTEYRSEYRSMLEDITIKCSELLMSHSSPVTQNFTVDYQQNSKTLYQRFAFIKSIVDSDGFHEAVRRIISSPVTSWKSLESKIDIRRAGRISSAQIRQISSCGDRIKLPTHHRLQSLGGSGVSSVPRQLSGRVKTDTVDTPENRFIKYVLQVFQGFCSIVCTHIENQGIERPAVYLEACLLEKTFAEYLNHSLFREISSPETLPLNSPVLQRKEGYREILRIWLMFDLAARLCWNALDQDQYHAGKRDVATLYEYWVFFKLLDAVCDVFDIPSGETGRLLQPTKDGMGLQLRQGRHVALSGQKIINNRHCEIRFHYNRTFSKKESSVGSSWTQYMRPDYTLSIWPSAFTEIEAEQQESIVHIHFDAKYRIDGLSFFLEDPDCIPPEDFDMLSEEEQENILAKIISEKTEQKEGTYKRADLLKMHAYKDAIRRTVGAYIIYPGSTTRAPFREFHELIPGLGAFALSPSVQEDGIESLKKFIQEVAFHFTNRCSQRETYSFYTYEIMKNDPDSIVHERVPEYFELAGKRKRIKPVQDTYVLYGFVQDKQKKWILEHGIYNIRMDREITPEIAGADFLVLYDSCENGIIQPWKNGLFRILGNPVIRTKDWLVSKNYPNPGQLEYFIYTISPVLEDWSVNKLTPISLSSTESAYRPVVRNLRDVMEKGSRHSRDSLL